MTQGVVRDAVSMIETWGGGAPTVAVLIGDYLIASDLALMYSGKWHRWPRSSTLSDRLRYGSSQAQRMKEAPIRLRDGELVLARRSAASLDDVETAILERIKAEVALCQLPHPSTEVIAYRVAGPAGCPPK